MFIRTERLFLRPSWPEDLEELIAILDRGTVDRSIGGRSLPEDRAALTAALSHAPEHRLPSFLINVRDERGARLIGGVGLARCAGDVELGCWIMRGERGKGYVAEATRAVLEQARTLGHRQVITADYSGSDLAAPALTESGFRPVGGIGSQGLELLRQRGNNARLYVAELADQLFELVKTGRRASA